MELFLIDASQFLLDPISNDSFRSSVTPDENAGIGEALDVSEFIRGCSVMTIVRHERQPLRLTLCALQIISIIRSSTSHKQV